jgi:hypothetical protein
MQLKLLADLHNVLADAHQGSIFWQEHACQPAGFLSGHVCLILGFTRVALWIIGQQKLRKGA